MIPVRRAQLTTVCAALVLVTIGFTPRCADHRQSPRSQGEPCDSAVTQLELTMCRAELAQRAEQRLTERYAAAVQALEAKGRNDLVGRLDRSQHAWAGYRDSHCEAIRALYEGGSAAAMIEADCRGRLAQERARELDSTYLDWASR